MSDRCWLAVRVLRSDIETVEEMIGTFDDVLYEDERSVTGIIHEAPGAYQNQLKELARRGTTFEGYHEACIGAWDAHAFVGVNGVYTEILCAPMRNGTPVVLVEEGGKVSANSLAHARAFCDVLMNATEVLDGSRPSAGSDTVGAAP